jgi:hypothetical protein
MEVQMKTTFLLALCALFLPLSAANASSIRHCRIEAEIVSITETITKDETRVSLSLKVINVQDLGHDAGPCQAVGEVFTFEPDNDQMAIDAKLMKGDHIQVEDQAYYNLIPNGFVFNESKFFVKKLEAPKKKSPKKKTSKKKTS